jgi:DNA topoisomerase-3
MDKYDYLIIAEKESLAKAIAKAFDKYRKKNGYYEFEDKEFGKGKIFYTFGHIVEVDVNQTLSKAGYPQTFPAFPEERDFKLQPKAGRKKLYSALVKEIKSGNYKAIIHAGDCDREGELLVREVLELTKPSKPIYRLWYNSLQPKEIRRAMRELKPLKEFDKLYLSALARRIADFWLGINSSIALQKKLNNRNQSLGRVQTPVLKLIVDRDREIENFKPERYFIVKILCEKDGKQFWAYWFNPKSIQNSQVKVEQDDEKEQSKEEQGSRLTEEKAKEIVKEIEKIPYAVVVKVEKKRKSELPPRLPKLSDLQYEAGKLYKLKAGKTLEVVQKLYERGIVSYPRTDSSYLSTKDRELVEEVLTKLGRKDLIGKIPDRIFNDKDVAEAGHHAIIPLDKLPPDASELEKRVYNLILRRFLAQFYPPYRFETTTVILKIGNHYFKATGKVDIDLGWKILYTDKVEKETKLPQLSKGEKVRKLQQKAEEKWTKPPAPYTSATLVKKMEKLGLGTQATRGNYEKILQTRGYITIDKNGIIHATPLGKELISQVEKFTFINPEFTAKFEKYLDAIAKGRFDAKQAYKNFLEKSKQLTALTVKEIDNLQLDLEKLKAKEKSFKAKRKKRKFKSKKRGKFKN